MSSDDKNLLFDSSTGEPNPLTLRLRPIVNCSVEQQIGLLEIRNSAEVRRWMYHSEVIPIPAHLAFIAGLKNDETRQFFVVLQEEKPIGAVIFSQIDSTNGSADWAFYLSSGAMKGLGSALEVAALNYLFQDRKIEKLHCEVLEDNERVVRMHQRFGFEVEGQRASAVHRAEGRVGYILLGITRSKWVETSTLIYRQIREKLPNVRLIVDDSLSDDSLESIIGQIQQARAQNNVNWMNILRIALEKSPSTAGPIVEDITRMDGRIQKLSSQLGMKSGEQSDS